MFVFNRSVNVRISLLYFHMSKGGRTPDEKRSATSLKFECTLSQLVVNVYTDFTLCCNIHLVLYSFTDIRKLLMLSDFQVRVVLDATWRCAALSCASGVRPP